MVRAFCLALLLCFPAVPAAAQNLLPGFTGFTIDQPPDPPPPGGVKHYGATGVDTPWAVAQWNIPGGALSPFARQADGSFIAKAPEANVRVQPGGSVKLEQTGALLPCEDAKEQPRESDLFFAPVGHPAAVGLAKLASLHQTADVTADSALLPDHVCPVNQGGAMFAIIVMDKAVHPAQIIFYQLHLSEICHPGPGGTPCPGVHHLMFYYSRTNPYGTDDYLTMVGHGFIDGSGPVHLDIDMLPRLKAAIAGGPPSMDKDFSHWQLNGVYGGQNIWGGVHLATSWSGYSLTAVPAP
jgi:hypothetical protein